MIAEPDGRQQIDEHIGGDGVLVRTGALWSETSMRLEPQARR